MRNHGLTIAFGAAFLLALMGQSIAGFLVNWQSEYLQFFLFILATIWLVQRGSPESKEPGDEGLGSDEEQLVHEHATERSPAWAKVHGWRHTLFSNSLLLTMGAIFLLSWLAQSLAGVVVFNDEQAQHGEEAIGWLEYIGSPDFWDRTLQNWQSELLAVGSMIALSIYLRQRGSPESKPVGAPHDESHANG